MKELKRHILCEYITSNRFDEKKKTAKHLHTKEVTLEGPTYLTHSDLESSDPDEFFVYCSTLETKRIESSDPDSFAGPTKLTYTLEETDEDEFIC